MRTQEAVKVLNDRGRDYRRCWTSLMAWCPSPDQIAELDVAYKVIKARRNPQSGLTIPGSDLFRRLQWLEVAK